MLLKSLSAVNSRGMNLNLPLNDPSNGFSVRDIQGLGPVNANVVSTPFAEIDGEEYHSSHRGNRNIVIRLGLNPDYGQESVYDLRNQLYAYFMTKSEIKLKFELYDKFADETLNVEIDGVVETSEPSIFSKDPEITVSVLCHQPDFVDPNVITINGASVGSAIYLDIDYEGTTEAGFLLTVTADRYLYGAGDNYSFTMGQIRPDGLEETIKYNSEMNIGDVVQINFIPGDKYVWFFEGGGGLPENKIASFDSASKWLQLWPGLNKFLFFARDLEVGVPYSISYKNRYGGI